MEPGTKMPIAQLVACADRNLCCLNHGDYLDHREAAAVSLTGYPPLVELGQQRTNQLFGWL